MKEHRIKLILLLVGVVLIIASIITVLYCKKKDETAWYSDGVAIRDIYVEDRELTAIETDDDDIFVGFYNYYQPIVVEGEGIYYYDVIASDSANYQLCYNNEFAGEVVVDVPYSNAFSVGAIIDHAIYGIEYEATDNTAGGNVIVRYNDSQRTKLCDKTISTCYFAKEGIYYQTDGSIYLMDYSGGNEQLILEIPVELYYLDELSSMVVYKDKLWYCYDDTFRDFAFPMWCYDFDGNIYRFSRGSIDKINNGFFYYTVTDEEYNNSLYRFDVESYEVEMVIDNPDISEYSFYEDHIVFISYDAARESEALYKMNFDVCEPFLYSAQLGSSNFLLQTSACDNRLFVTGGSGMFYTYLAEIDLEGNIINNIHEDEFEWYFTDETSETSPEGADN